MVDVLTRRMTGQTVKIYPFSSESFEGDETYGSANSHDCRVDQVTDELVDDTGKRAIITADVYIPGDVSVTDQAKIELPDGSTPEIVTINKERDIEGTIRYTLIRTGRLTA